MNLKRMTSWCVLCVVALGCAGSAFGKSDPPDEAKPMTLLGFGFGLGLHYAPTLRLELRPVPWISVATRLSAFFNGVQIGDAFNDRRSVRWRFLPLVTLGGQVSGIWPVGAGHQVALRVGFDFGRLLGLGCLSSDPPQCTPDSWVLFDGSAGWAWQSGSWEARVDIGVGYASGIENEPYERASSAMISPTLLVTGLYWFL